LAQWNESAAAQTRSDAQMNTTQRTAWTCLGGRYHAVPVAELQPLRAHFGLTGEFDADVRSPIMKDRTVPPVCLSAVITPCLAAQPCRTALPHSPAARRCRRVAAARTVCLFCRWDAGSTRGRRPGAAWYASPPVFRVPAQMWEGRAQSWCICQRSAPSPVVHYQCSCDSAIVQVLISDAVRKRIFDTAGAARVKVGAARSQLALAPECGYSAHRMTVRVKRISPVRADSSIRALPLATAAP
jgi:hypothetical protein